MGIDKFDCLIHAFGCKNAPGEGVEKTFTNLPGSRLRDERGINGFDRGPDVAFAQARAHQIRYLCRYARQHVAIKMKPLCRIRVASLQIMSQKTLASAVSNFIKTPLVMDEGVLC